MYFLNKLKDYKLYRVKPISGVSDSNKNQKKGQLVLTMGTYGSSLPDIIKANIFKQSLFNSVFMSKRYYTNNRRVLNQISDINGYYDELSTSAGTALFSKANLDSYNGRNVFIDTDRFLRAEESSLSSKSATLRADNFVTTIQKLTDISYDDVIILFDLSNNGNSDWKTMSNIIKSKNPLSYIVYLLRNNIPLKLNRDQKLHLVFTNKEFLMKIDIGGNNSWDDLFENKVIIINRLKSIFERSINIADEVEDDTEVVPSDRLPQPTKKKQVSDADIEKYVQNVKYLVFNGSMDTDIAERISKRISEIATESQWESDNISIYSAIDILTADEEFKEIAIDQLTRESIGKSNTKKIERNKLLFEKQSAILERVDIKEAAEKAKNKKIDVSRNEKIDSVNDEIRKSMITNDFDKSYMEKQFVTDMVSTFKSFNDDVDIPIFINNITIEDSSDTMSYKDTISVQLRDDNNITHNVKVDIPKIYDGKYLKINGSKKIITKQLMMLPIIKTKPGEVWITTNYNKLIIERFGRKDSLSIDYFSKLFTNTDINDYVFDSESVSFRKGNSVRVNSKFNVSIDYVNMSSKILSLNINKSRFIFNQRLLLDTIEKDVALKMTFNADEYFPFGYENDASLLYLVNYEDNKVYTLDRSGKITGLDTLLIDYVISRLTSVMDPSIDKVVSPVVKANQSTTFSRVKIINKLIPMIILLGSEIGLTETLNRYSVKYEFSAKDVKIRISDNKSKIKFKDGYLIYDTSKMRNSLLFSGLKVIDTTAYTFDEMNTKEPYLEYYSHQFNSRNVSKGVHNALTLCVDPITKETLEDLGQPTNIIDILLYANSMLEDLTSKSFNDMSIYRLRGAEQINGLLYKIIATAYKNYKDSMNNRNPIKISVPRDQLIKKLLEMPTLDENSDLNPSLEIDKQTAVTYRGHTGRNSSDSYMPEIRGYDKSMSGLLGISSPDSATIGVVRQLSYDPKIKGTRGYIDTDATINSSTSILTPLELLSPWTATKADAPRIGIDLCPLYRVIGRVKFS